MRVNVQRGLFARPLTFTTTEDGEMICTACGALVRDKNAHRDFHLGLQQVARTADEAEAAGGRSRW